MNTRLPGQGNVGVTGGSSGCVGGRIVTADTGGQSDAIPYCPDVNGDGVADPPPSHPEIVAALCPDAAMPEAILRTSPADRGITGLEIWFWSAGEHERHASGTVGGYASTCTLQSVGFDVDSGDTWAEEFGHERHHHATGPGHDGPDTSITHLYERVGTYTQTLWITWTRTTNAGSDTTTTTTSKDYLVIEVRPGMTTAPDWRGLA